MGPARGDSLPGTGGYVAEHLLAYCFTHDGRFDVYLGNQPGYASVARYSVVMRVPASGEAQVYTRAAAGLLMAYVGMDGEIALTLAQGPTIDVPVGDARVRVRRRWNGP